jgi:hypothetical protein
MFGRANALQTVEHWQARFVCEHFCDFFCLVEMTVLEAPCVQWDRHQRPATDKRWCQAWVIERLRCEASEIFSEMYFTLIFQAMNHLQCAFVSRHRWSGELE